MDLRNYTPFPSQGFISTAGDGSKFYTIVLKATFRIRPGRTVSPAPDQIPITMSDEYYGETNVSSLRAESDLAPAKSGADVYFVDPIAYAPEGKAAASWMVGVKVGGLRKSFRVTGPRSWTYSRIFGWKLSEPEPATTVPIRYELAFGGCWKHEEESDGFDRNAVGRGFVSLKHVDRSQPIPAPQLEDPAEPVQGLGKAVAPVGLGPLTRTWQPRLRKAGTYDDRWRETRWPVAPEDFDIGFFNCASSGLTSERPFKGDEAVEVSGLTPGGLLRFKLCGLRPMVVLRMKSGEYLPGPIVLDTVVFDLEAERVSLVWRGYAPIDPPARVAEIRLATMPEEAAVG